MKTWNDILLADLIRMRRKYRKQNQLAADINSAIANRIANAALQPHKCSLPKKQQHKLGLIPSVQPN